MNQEAVRRSLGRFRSILLLIVVGSLFPAGKAFALAAVDAGACSENSQSRQLDFWLGDWIVTYPGMPGSAASNVSLDLNQCLLVERWAGGKGHNGKNMFAYSADDKSWHGMFADSQGRVHVFEGKVAPGSAEFSGPSVGADGRTVLNRIKVVRVSADKVEQSWEKSMDHGATWTMEFRGEYSRKNP
jgi:hypothetical protein